MSNEEFSDQFQTLISSYLRFRDFDDREPKDTLEFDEYEKSLFLTKAEKDIVLSLYNGRNSANISFEETEELRRYLSNLVEEARLTPIATTNGKPLGVDSRSKFFTLPDNLWFITYESVAIQDADCDTLTNMEVIPVRQDEYHRIKKNPFRGPNGRKSLRLDLSENNVEIVSKFNVASYYVRYVRKVKPIVLVDLPNELTIEGYNTETPCELHETLHQKILENAVMMALQSKGYKINNNENK